ncbi:MAG: PH domain-containing protein [Chloroflexota bacterium]
MSLKEAQARIQARIWQAVAQTDLDLSALDKETLTSLVDLVTEAALLELDQELETSFAEEMGKQPYPAVETNIEDILNDHKEDVLWEGRPFLSLTLHYTITDERIRITEGLLGKAHDNVELIRVQDLDYKQTLSERLLNLGDVTIRSGDRSKPIITLNNVKEPEKVYEILRRAVLSARKRHNFAFRDEM